MLSCMNDIVAVSSYLTAVKRYCPPTDENAVEALGWAIPAAANAIRLAAKKTPEAALVSVLEPVFRQRYPCGN